MANKIVFPDLRPTKTKLINFRIEVGADALRVGKTTAVKVIARGLRKRGMKVSVSYEDWRHNPYLKQSYTDPAKNFLESQKWFIERKYRQIREGARLRQGSGEVKQVFIQDVAPETDFCYAATNLRLGRMSQEHFALYDQYYRSLDWRLAPAPDLLVYLSVSDKELIKRADESRREFETVEKDYFLMMKKVNREWLKEFEQKRKILIIDTDNLDFSNEKEAKVELVRKVSERIGSF